MAVMTALARSRQSRDISVRTNAHMEGHTCFIFNGVLVLCMREAPDNNPGSRSWLITDLAWDLGGTNKALGALAGLPVTSQSPQLGLSSASSRK